MNIEQKTNNNTSPTIEAKQCYAKPSIKLFNCDNLQLMAKMEDESVDIILTDPPYLYLTNQKLERPFDEQLFFSECKRVLTKNGFIVLFGRGTSFYRWNTILADLGFNFKEEVIWNKRRSSSPTHKLQRYHETISIFSKSANCSINKIRIPYLESKENDIEGIIHDINRLSSALKNEKDFKAIVDYLRTKSITLTRSHNNTLGCTVASNSLKVMSVAPIYMRAINEGIVEKSIIENTSEQNRVHPTQKPVRLLERLLALVIPQNKDRKDIVIADFFGGSFSTMEAVYNMGMQGISCEIDKEYFESGKNRIERLPPIQINLFE